MDVPLPKPRNRFVEVMNLILDNLIQGVGAAATIALVTAQVPWLATPVVSWIFRQIVTLIAQNLDIVLQKRIDRVIIRFQNDARKGDYDNQIEIINKPGATPDEIQAAKDALDRLVNRNK